MVKIIFMIDDDQDDREIFLEAIQKCFPAVEVLFAQDGLEALAFLNSSDTNPDVIFLDYNMPRMNGVQYLKELKGNGKTRDIPVVMYTTSGDRTHAEIILAMGADYYMQKTNGFNELCLELERLFQTLEKDLQARNDLKDR